jgi:hypothetical protein
VFTAAAAMTVVAALASLMRGSRYVHDDSPDASDSEDSAGSVDAIPAPAGSQPATMG